MSVKINDGLKSLLPSSNVFSVVDAVRRTCEPVFFQSLWDSMGRIEKTLKVIGKTPHKGQLLADIFNEPGFRQEIFSDYEHVAYSFSRVLHDPHNVNFSGWNTTCDVAYGFTVFENSCDGENPLLLPYSFNSPRYVKALVDSGLFTEYGYWDNTDIPEGVSDMEWNQRKKEWLDASSWDSDVRSFFHVSPLFDVDEFMRFEEFVKNKRVEKY